MGKGDTAAAKKRTRRPLNKYSAGEAIEKILAQIPPDQHDAVLTFVRSGRTTQLPAIAWTRPPTMQEMLDKANAEIQLRQMAE